MELELEADALTGMYFIEPNRSFYPKILLINDIGSCISDFTCWNQSDYYPPTVVTVTQNNLFPMSCIRLANTALLKPRKLTFTALIQKGEVGDAGDAVQIPSDQYISSQ
jgi:hypothetical protein